MNVRIVTAVLSGCVITLAAQTVPAPAALPHPQGYVAQRTASGPAIDGRLDDGAWAAAPWTDLFVDIEGDAKPKPLHATRAKMLWDNTYLYIGADLVEPHLWATITAHDAVIFREHDFEVFIDPDADSHEYYEFEINALGTFWDLMLPTPYRAGGHAVDSWEMTGVRAAVHRDGTLNDARDTDRGWSVELAFPWAAMSADERKPSVPKPGDQWRINFSRVEWPVDVVGTSYRAKAGAAEFNWVWSPQRVVDMHRPERWGYVQFAEGPAAFVPDASWPARQWLQSVFDAQREFQRARGRYAATLTELGVAAPADPSLSDPRIAVTSSLFEASIAQRLGTQPPARWHIRFDARVWRDDRP